ncbi:MAG: thioredoxin TrxC [Rudaea sp.]|nr:thioredoxin TrxC [Rudaea sp.]
MNQTVQVVCPDCATINRVPTAKMKQMPSCGRCHQPLFQGKPVGFDADTFERHVVRGDLPVLVDFWAPWCGPCLVMAPQFESAAQRLEPTMRLGKVDTESQPELAARFAIRSIPTMILFHRGHEIARQSGALSATEIERWVRRIPIS